MPVTSQGAHYRPVNTVVTEPEGSVPLILKAVIGHDPEPVPSTSYPHKHLPENDLNVILLSSPSKGVQDL
jgi:hypothetical protein